MGACWEASHSDSLRQCWSLDVIQSLWGRWRLPEQVWMAASASLCAEMCFEAQGTACLSPRPNADPPAASQVWQVQGIFQISGVEVLGTQPQRSRARLDAACWLSRRALLSLFCLGLQSTSLLCCGTEGPLCSIKTALLTYPPTPHCLPDFITHLQHTHTDTHRHTVPLNF